MKGSPLVWFAAGVATVYAFHKFVKPIPGKKEN